MALIVESLRQALSEADLTVNVSQQQGTKIRGRRTAVEIYSHRQAINWRKTQLFWSTLRNRQTRLVSSEALFVEYPLYQWAEGDSPFFMNSSG